MKKVLLLFSQTSADTQKAYPEHLAKLLSEPRDDLTVEWSFFEDLAYYFTEETCEIIDTRHSVDISEYDSIYLRHWSDKPAHAMAVTRYCKQKQIPFVDSEAFRVGSYNKLTQYINLHEASVPFPRTLIATGEHLKENYESRGFVFPLILKSVAGTRGADNYLVKDAVHMADILEKNPDLLFVLQDFIPNDGDYRVVVLGDEVKLVIERKASGESHLNNTSQGGQARIIPTEDLPQDVRDASIRAAQFMGREIAGVDMVLSQADGRYYCFEVNRTPQVEHASFEPEKAVALADYLHGISR